MNILNLFTFKKDFKEIFSKETMTELFDYAKTQIVRYIEKSDLLGIEKKQRVDEAVLLYIDMKLQSDNSIIKFAIEFLKSIVPTITQFIYDYLKTFVNGLTKQVENV